MMRDAIWRGVVVCIPLKLRHSKMLGGGFHCVTLDIRRRGTLQRYFDWAPWSLGTERQRDEPFEASDPDSQLSEAKV
jgi:hypothetical protein